MSGSRFARLLLAPAAIIAMAALVRLALAIVMGDRFYFADTAEYEATAIRILRGLGPGESSPRAPLFPGFLAVAFAIGGEENRFVARLLQLALGTGLVALTGRLAGILGGPLAVRPALLAAAFSPLLVFSSCMLYPTTIYSLLLSGTAMTALALIARPTLALGAVLGVLIPLGWLTDPVFLAPAGTLVLVLACTLPKHGRKLAASLAVALLVMTAIIVPYRQATTPAGGQGGAFMQKAQYVLDWSRSDPKMAGSRHVRVPDTDTFVPLSATEFLAREWGLITTQPTAYAADVTREFIHFFNPLPDRVQTQNKFNQPMTLWAGALHFAPILLLAILGLLFGAGALQSRWVLASVVLSTAGFYSLFFSQARYRIPVEPMIIVLAALAIVRLMPRVAAHLAASDASEPASAPPPNGPRRT